MSTYNGTTDRIEVSRADADERVVSVCLDDPSRNNVISARLLRELHSALAWADSDELTEGILVGSTSEDVFCSGADLQDLKSVSVEEANRFLDEYLSIISLLWKTGKPVVTAVSGDCVAGGNELAIASDLIIAEQSARFGQPEAIVGSTAAGGGVQLLPLLIGLQRTKDLLYTGRLIPAETAKEWGLINRVVSEGDSQLQARKLLSDILDQKSPTAFRAIKTLLGNWKTVGMQNEGVARELTANVWATDEFRERANAFLSDNEFTPRRFTGTTTQRTHDE
jgi:enoyl-CoA hydratase/carnithine racemase